jgi:hypothetical protein
MKRRVSLCVLLVLAVVGCASLKPADILPGNDPVVVNTERSAKVALASFEAVTTYDHDNLAFMKDKLPAVHQQVQTLRVEFPPLYRAVRDATKAYKQSRLPADAAVMNSKLSDLTRLQVIAQQALATATQDRAKLQNGDQQPEQGVRAIQ